MASPAIAIREIHKGVRSQKRKGIADTVKPETWATSIEMAMTPADAGLAHLGADRTDFTSVRYSEAEALGKNGHKAGGAIPARNQALSDPDHVGRDKATQALRAVQAKK